MDYRTVAARFADFPGRGRLVVVFAAMLFVFPPSAGATKPLSYSIGLGGEFDLAGTRVACVVASPSGVTGNGLLCIRESAVGSYEPLGNSYAVQFAEGGVIVEQVAHDPLRKWKVLLTRTQTVTPTGYPPGYENAEKLRRGSARLRPGDAIFVNGTNIYCYATAKPLALSCVLLGADGRLSPGEYAANVGDFMQILRTGSQSRPDVQVVLSLREP